MKTVKLGVNVERAIHELVNHLGAMSEVRSLKEGGYASEARYLEKNIDIVEEWLARL